MRELAPLGLSDDGRFLTARDATTGERFRISIDRRLTALIARTPGAATRSGQLEIPMESSLSPRDIQTRIRRGESIEEVAEAAGVSYDQVAGFAVPVIAEREHMVDQARSTSVRRKNVGGPMVVLAELVDGALAERGLVPEDAEWDSRRREDGLWTVQVALSDTDTVAEFVFDPKSRFVVASDDQARRLVGDFATPEQDEMALADAVADTSPLADADEEPTVVVDDHAAVRSIKEARDRRALEQFVLDADDQTEAVSPAELDQDMAVPHTPGPTRKKPQRRAVPSWDEIMFGGPKGD